MDFEDRRFRCTGLTPRLDFFPNDDVAQARRARMRKAMERGALWARNWRDDVTHIIADKGLCYNDLISYLKVSALPVSALKATFHRVDG